MKAKSQIKTGKRSVVSFNNLKREPVPAYKESLSEGITLWETDSKRVGRNDFPQQLIQNVYNSPVASAAMEIWQEFIEGDGFVEDIGSIKINTNGDDGTPQTLESLHSNISHDFAYLDGFAVHVSYNSEGAKTEFHHLPFESTRLGELDDEGVAKDIKYNPYFGIPRAYETKYTKTFYTYNPNPEFVKRQMTEHAALFAAKKVDYTYPGQVFWFALEKPLARVYPQPFYYSSMNWFIVDSKIQKFHERNIDNNFLLSVIINMYGDPDAPADKADENKDQYKTVGEVFNEQLQEQFTGAINGGSAMVNWFTRLEEMAKIEAFPSNTHHELFLTLQKITSDQIAIGTKVPRVLVSISESGKLGDTQEVLNAIRVMQGRVNRKQRTLERVYKKLFTGFEALSQVIDYTIKNINPFNILPDWVIAELTPEEKRKYISENFNIEIVVPEVSALPGAPGAQVETNEAMKNMTGRQLQGILRIARKFNKEELTFDQAAQMLKAGFGMNDSDIQAWLVTNEEA
jgi:hypothetical protein